MRFCLPNPFDSIVIEHVPYKKNIIGNWRSSWCRFKWMRQIVVDFKANITQFVCQNRIFYLNKMSVAGIS